jgi:hypothetical protein
MELTKISNLYMQVFEQVRRSSCSFVERLRVWQWWHVLRIEDMCVENWMCSVNDMFCQGDVLSKEMFNTATRCFLSTTMSDTLSRYMFVPSTSPTSRCCSTTGGRNPRRTDADDVDWGQCPPPTP